MSFRDFIRTITMRHKPTFLYNLRTEGDHFLITKHDEDMEVVSKYNMSLDGYSCDCPQSHRPTCRHRKMLPMMRERVDTGWFFDYDNTGQWSDPFGTEGEALLDTEPRILVGPLPAVVVAIELDNPEKVLDRAMGADADQQEAFLKPLSDLKRVKVVGAFIPNRRRL